MGETPRQSSRLAVVQFDYQPSAYFVYPHIEEPALLAEGEQGITSLHLSVSGVEEKLQAFRREVSKEHEEFIRKRLNRILTELNRLQVDIVVFPEYSIPASCLSEIEESAGDCTVVAASHTVTPETAKLCKNVGINLEASDVGKSICPVLLNGHSWDYVHKLSRSKWEGTLKPGTVWRPIEVKDRKGEKVVFGVFLCVDFINEHDENVQRFVKGNIWTKLQFAVVPSYSPTLRDFEQRARPVIERAGRPVAYANVSSLGGSRIYSLFGETGPFIERHGTKSLAPGDEAVVVVDVPLGEYSQFNLSPTPLPTPTSSELVSVLPILSRERFSKFWAVRDRIRATTDDEQKRKIAQGANSDLVELASQSDIPIVLKSKVFALLEAMSWRDGQWLDACLDCIPFPADEASLDEKRFALLYKAQSLLAALVKDPRLKGIELDSVASTLDVYRRKLDALRPRVRPQVRQRFEASDLAIHTVGGDSASADFTSVFLMRLRSARVHRESLEKQIRLISTIAHKGNKYLALNLRYISVPNPGGNLKDLEIQVIGAARADQRADSRKMAETFSRDLVNLMRVTLRDAYLFQLQELEPADLAKATEPFHLNEIVELRRNVDFGIRPYVDQSTSPKIHHLAGSSTMSRILDSLQSSPFACMVSMHLHPVLLSEAEEAFFRSYRRATSYQQDVTDGAMFFLGTERHPALRLGDAVTMQRMLGNTEGLHSSLLARLFVASDEPISPLLLNTIGNELWGNDSYQIHNFSENEDELDAAKEAIRLAWGLEPKTFADAPEQLDRVPFLYDPYEASRIFRLPLEGYSGAVGTLFTVIPAPAAALPDEGIEIGLGFHSGAQKPIVVRLSDDERTKHTYVIGKTGTGKSTLLSRMIEQDIQRGSGVCVIDPHGDLVDATLNRIPENRRKDVVLLDPAITDRPFGLNLLEYDPTVPHHKDFVVQETIAIMRKLFYFEHSGPIFEHNLRLLVLTMLDESIHGEGTLIEVPRPLYDSRFREALVPRLKDEMAIDFWQQYKQLSSSTSSDYLWYVISKFDSFTIDHTMRNIIGQAHSTINFAEILDKKKILLVKLPSALIGELNAALLGMIIISKLRWAGMARASLPPSERQDYFIYVDEFQNFAASGFDTILAEARKYKLSLVLANQHIGQLSAFNISTGRTEDKVSQAIFGNVGTMIAFRLGVNDAKFIAEEMGKPADPEDLENLKNYYALVKTLIDGEVYPPFTIQTLLSPSPDRPEVAEQVRQESLDGFGKPKDEVEKDIRERQQRIIDGFPAVAPPLQNSER